MKEVKTKPAKHELDNRSTVLNDNNPKFYKSRGIKKPSDK